MLNRLVYLLALLVLLVLLVLLMVDCNGPRMMLVRMGRVLRVVEKERPVQMIQSGELAVP